MATIGVVRALPILRGVEQLSSHGADSLPDCTRVVPGAKAHKSTAACNQLGGNEANSGPLFTYAANLSQPSSGANWCHYLR